MPEGWDEGWDEEQRLLQDRARRVTARLGLDQELERFGVPTVTGSVALGVMVARDVDITVTVGSLGGDELAGVGELAARLVGRPDVREVTVRNDTGRWNVDPDYPDGVYLHIRCRDEDGEQWTFDVWFVDEPDRQPDLAHLRDLAPRITPETQAAILRIKRATGSRRADGSRLPSVEIYRAVLDRGVRDTEDFLRLSASG